MIELNEEPIREMSDPQNIRRSIEKAGDYCDVALETAEEAYQEYKEGGKCLMIAGVTFGSGLADDFVSYEVLDSSKPNTFSVNKPQEKVGVYDSGTLSGAVDISNKGLEKLGHAEGGTGQKDRWKDEARTIEVDLPDEEPDRVIPF